MEKKASLIVGLGNPGTKYEKTRHNLGFMVIESLAQRQGWSFKRGLRLQGKVASGVLFEQKLYLLFPTTYMNLSGRAVRKALSYFQVDLPNLLVVADDIYLKFGAMRLREKGSAGGHNGLKSVEGSLQTQEYSRLKMGVGKDDLLEGDLEKYVLGKFSQEEQAKLPLVIDRGVEVVTAWLNQGLATASQLAGDLSNQPLSSL